jgi:hypothetical protein
MTTYTTDIYIEPTEMVVHTLDNLGPLTRMAGIWKGSRSLDVPTKPVEAPERQEYIEHTELQPIDPQTNGPQLLYGLRYHTHIVTPGESKPITIRWDIGCGNPRPEIYSRRSQSHVDRLSWPSAMPIGEIPASSCSPHAGRPLTVSCRIRFSNLRSRPSSIASRSRSIPTGLGPTTRTQRSWCVDDQSRSITPITRSSQRSASRRPIRSLWRPPLAGR